MTAARLLMISIMLPMVAVTTLGGAGCEMFDQSRSNGNVERDALTDLWPFWPTDMRFHPLTRWATDAETGATIIEARIEFTDAQGIATRGVGMLSIELHSDLPGSDAIGIWNRNLADLSLNTTHLDDVTRTYLFRLQIDPNRLAERMELHARFVSDNDVLLEASHRVRPRP